MTKKKKTLLLASLLILTLIVLGVYLFIIKEERPGQEPLIPVSEEELVYEETVYPEEPIETPSDRTLVRERDDNEIFWLQNEKRYLVLNPYIIWLMTGIEGWDKINQLPPEALKGYPHGPDFIAPEPRSDNLLIRMKETTYVFEMRDGKRAYLPSEDFKAQGYDPEDVIEVSTKIIKLLPPAPPIEHLSLQEAVQQDQIEIIGSGKYFEEGVVFEAGPYEGDVAVNIKKGDVLLSKAGKQSLVVTQDFEVFVPKGERITLEGLWVACIDRFKDWPGAGEKLDVTLNLADWKLKAASTLLALIETIDEKNVHREPFAQEAIWKITDNEPIASKAQLLLAEAGIDPEIRTSFLHLSNPDPSPETVFVVPPELSLLGLTANRVENCPQDKEGADKIICREEIELAAELYLKKQIFPGTVEQKIDARLLSLLLSFYLTQTSIEETLPPVSQEEINEAALTLLASLQQKGLELPALKVEEVELLPSYIVEQETTIFKARGEGIREIEVKVFNLEGEMIFESGPVFGNLFEWQVRDEADKLLPNGFYSYLIEARGFREELFESAQRQLIIRQ